MIICSQVIYEPNNDDSLFSKKNIIQGDVKIMYISYICFVIKMELQGNLFSMIVLLSKVNEMFLMKSGDMNEKLPS